MLFVWMSPWVMKPVRSDPTSGCGPSSSRRSRVADAGRQRAAPAERHARTQLAAEHVVADAVGLHAELDLVLAAAVAVRRAVGVEVRAGLLVVSRPPVFVGMLVKPVPCCRFGRHVQEVDVVRGRSSVKRGSFGDVEVVRVRLAVPAADAHARTSARPPSSMSPDSAQFGNFVPFV